MRNGYSRTRWYKWNTSHQSWCPHSTSRYWSRTTNYHCSVQHKEYQLPSSSGSVMESIWLISWAIWLQVINIISIIKRRSVACIGIKPQCSNRQCRPPPPHPHQRTHTTTMATMTSRTHSRPYRISTSPQYDHRFVPEWESNKTPNIKHHHN